MDIGREKNQDTGMSPRFLDFFKCTDAEEIQEKEEMRVLFIWGFVGVRRLVIFSLRCLGNIYETMSMERYKV